jgi:Flp pilus assembly protein TadG
MSKLFFQNDRGGVAIAAGLLMPVLVGAGALATDVGLFAFKHEQMQGAADAAALAAVIAQTNGISPSQDGLAVAGSTGYPNGQNGVTVVVNTPPTSGAYAGLANHVEVIIQQPYQPTIAKIFSSAQVNVRARAVARKKSDGGACVLSLNTSNKANDHGLYFQGTSDVSLSGCNAHANGSGSSAVYAQGSARVSASAVSTPGLIDGADGRITTTDGLHPGTSAITDPYASLSYPTYSKSSAKAFPVSGTINPGVYTGPIQGAVTMTSGVYYVDANTFSINGGASLQGSEVTIVLVDMFNKLNANSNLVMLNGNSPVDLTAPKTGSTAGVVVFAERSLTSKITFNGGSSQRWGGAIYMPAVDFTYVGGAGGIGCTQVIADRVSLGGTATMALNCGNTAVKPITNQMAELIE